jgi:DNA-binding NtrC family response regulator
LVVDDDDAMREVLAEGLRAEGLGVVGSDSAEAALARLDEAEVDVVVTDVSMTGMTGLALCERVTANRPDVPVIVLTAFGSMQTAVDALRAGAYDFVNKPVELDELAQIVDRAVRHRAATRYVRRVAAADQSLAGPASGGLIGSSQAVVELQDLIGRVAASDASVLITGESGTGKELVARALHQQSRRRDGPFVAVNCSAIAETLLESQLFGHKRGAFTDARRDQPGLFVQAHGGTLLLDEITEMPRSLQPKLLRALQERSVRPLGGDREIPFDVRILAATNRDVAEAVSTGRLREDLYFRLNVVEIETPTLRARGEDVLLLAKTFAERFAHAAGKVVTGVSAVAAERLLAYDWPGNVRELQNCIEGAIALTRFDQIGVDDLPARVRQYRCSTAPPASPSAPADDEILPMDEVERRHIMRALEATKGSRTVAARLLGLDRKTLYRKLLRYGLDDGSDAGKSDGPAPSSRAPGPKRG